MEIKDWYLNKIREAYKAVSRHIVSGAMGPQKAPGWPLSILATRYIYSKFYPQKLLDIMKKLESQGFSQKDIGNMFYGPSAVSHWFYSANFPFEGFSNEETIDFIKRTIDIVEHWRRKDPFCMDWRNIIWGPNKIKDKCDREGFIDSRSNKRISKILGRINMIAWHYCLLIQVGHRNYSHEFHGPYNLGNNEILFVREYFKLRPYEIWPFASSQNIPFNKMRILEIYKDVDIKVDAFNHVLASPSLIPHLQRFLVILDDSAVLSKNEVGELFNKWTDIITKASEFIKNYRLRDFLRKVIEMKYWLLKPHAQILGEDWRPPKDILKLAGKYEEAQLMAKKAIKGQKKIIKGYPEDKAIKRMTQMFLDNVYKGKMYF